MLVLDTTSKTITAKLDVNPATPLFWVTTWADNNSTTFTEGAYDGVLGDTSANTIVSAPASSTRRIVKSINIQNPNSTQVNVTIGYVNSLATPTTKVVAKVILNAGDTWTTDGTFDKSGQIKYVYGSVDVTNITGVLQINNGGTGQTTSTEAFNVLSPLSNEGDLLYRYNGSSAPLTIGSAGQVLTSYLGYPSWRTLSYISAYPSGTGIVTVSGGSAWGTTITTPSGSLVGNTAVQTLDNKRINPRVTLNLSGAVSSPYQPNIDSYDLIAIKNLSTSPLVFNTPTGVLSDGFKLMFRISDNGISRNLDFTAYIAVGVTPPTSTTPSKVTYVGAIYNADQNRWEIIATGVQA